MQEIGRLFAANQRYASARQPAPASPHPSRRLAIVTCMDVRIDPLAVFGLQLGEAHVIRNAGGRVTDDVLRSLAVSAHVLGVRTVVTMQHTRCGMAGTTDAELREATGAGLDFLAIGDHRQALESDMELLALTGYLAPITTAVGLLYDVDAGSVQEIARWQRSN